MFVLLRFHLHVSLEEKLKFKNMKLKYYHDHWVSLVRLDGQYSAVHSLNSIYLNSVDVSFHFSHGKLSALPLLLGRQCHNKNAYSFALSGTPELVGRFILPKIFCDERFIYFHEDDLLCLRERKSTSGFKLIFFEC